MRLPVSGDGAWRPKNEKFPRENNTGAALPTSSSATFVDFSDFETLADFTCPDGSHLDAKDRAPFTTALAAVLKDKIRQP